MNLLRGAIAAGVRNPVFANLLMICMLGGGCFAVRAMQRETYPEFSLDVIFIEAVYPGASAEDVEQAVCVRLEEAITDVEGVHELTSAAHEALANVWFTVRSTARDTGEILQEVRDRVDRITTFPPEVEKPVVRESVVHSDAISIALYGEVSERALKHWAREVRDELRDLPEISQVTLSGVRADEIIIEVSEQALRAYGLTFEAVMAAVRLGSLDLPAGTLRTAGEELTLRIKGRLLRAVDYEELVVLQGPDALVRLGQIAAVREGFAEAVVNGSFNGQPAVLVSVFKTSGQDTLAIARGVREYVRQRQAALTPGLRMSVWADGSADVEQRIGMLLKNAAAGFVLVVITLSLFLEMRLALWVAVGMPVAFSGALIFMYFSGQTVNLISLFALIMVSGIIVDDAIVIAESIHSRRRQGVVPELASIEGAGCVALPVLGSSLTTIIAFIPLLYVSGVMGKFVHVLPMVVIAAIVASALESFVILPAHLSGRGGTRVRAEARALGRGRRFVEHRMEVFITRRYRPFLALALRYRAVTLCAALGALLALGGVVLGGRVSFVLLQRENGNLLRAQVQFAEGTPAEVTQAAIARIEAAAWALNADPELKPATEGKLVRQVYAVAGEFVEFLPVRGDNVCEVRLELMPSDQRRLEVDSILERWRAGVGELHDTVRVSFARHQLEPPGDYPIEIRLLGTDLEDLADAGERIAQRLRDFDGVAGVRLDLVPGRRELQVDLRPAARALGLTLQDVATQLRQGFFGGEAVRLQREREEVVVRVRYPERERLSLADLESKAFRTQVGGEIPFREAVEVNLKRGYSEIRRQDNLRRVRVLADVDERRANAERIVRALEADTLPQVVGEYHGMKYAFGGTRQQMAESLGSLYRGLWLALLVMYAVLAAVLRSYLQPLVIVAAVPLGWMGALVGHMVLGYDLTIMSLFGFVALAGVVVNDALVLLAWINDSRREGKGVVESVREAGEARFRAVVLTSITTVVGLMPLLAERSSQAQAVIPMALSLVFGLAFATVLTLVLVPALYLALNDARRGVRWLRRGGDYPTPEAVEPE